MIHFAHGSATDVGRVRNLNEDNLLVAESLFAVADGMGGHRAGEVASAEALESLRTSVLEPDAAALIAAVEHANRAVFEHSVYDPELSGMGTTLCAVALVRDDDGDASIAIVNVGDSRVYLLSGDQFRQITEDHSLVETMVRGGQLSPDEAAVHPGRNVLTRALGIEPDIDVDLFREPVRAGDRFLLCSDGLFNELHDDQISAVLRRLSAPAEAAADLVRRAAEAGGRDNITVVIVDVVDDGGAGAATATATVPATEDPVGFTAERTQPIPAVDAAATPPGAPAASSGPLARSTAKAAKAAKPAKPSRRESRRAARKSRGRAPITWRVWAFVAAIVIVIAVAVGTVIYASDNDTPTTTIPTTSSTSSTSTTTTTGVTTTVAPAAPAGVPASPAPGA